MSREKEKGQGGRGDKDRESSRVSNDENCPPQRLLLSRATLTHKRRRRKREREKTKTKRKRATMYADSVYLSFFKNLFLSLYMYLDYVLIGERR